MAHRPTSRMPRRRGAGLPGRARSRGGFSLIEVIVAMLVLTVGVLGLAAGTGWMIRTVHYGELETDRSTALQSAIETVRSGAFDDLQDGSDTFGDYTVSWTIGLGTAQARNVEFVVVGPGRLPSDGGMPEISNAVADTFNYPVLRRD